MYAVTASGAPTRRGRRASTLTSRVRKGSFHDTLSPTLTRADALATWSLRCTFPPRQAAVACERDLKNRTAHSQTSNLISSMIGLITKPES